MQCSKLHFLAELYKRGFLSLAEQQMCSMVGGRRANGKEILVVPAFKRFIKVGELPVRMCSLPRPKLVSPGC